MSDLDLALTEEEKGRFVTFFKANQKDDLLCPLCKETNWLIADHLVVPQIFANGGTQLGSGVAYPYVQISCKNCGHTFFFSAVKSGVVMPAIEEENDG